MATTVSGTTLTFNDSTTQTTAANPVGVGQTWQNVSASRAINTNYTNSTGKAIQVSIRAYYAVNQNAELKVGGITDAFAGWSSYASGAVGGTVTAIVPNGSTYQYYNVTGTATTPIWFELR
jgi:hypothetical protein